MKKIRVALSGSGFRFPSHVGALTAVVDKGYEIIELSGTSGGAIVSSLYASGKSVGQLKDITFCTDFSTMLEYNPLAIFKFSYCDGSKLQKFIESLLGRTRTFRDLHIPLHIIASDIRQSKVHVFDQPFDSVVQAVRASAAVPFMYSPVKLDSMWLVDGGICNNTPIDVLTDDGTLKLGVKLTSEIDTTPIDSAKDILIRTAELLFESNDNAHISAGKLEGALFSFVNTGTVGSFDKKMSRKVREELFSYGYVKTMEVLNVYENEISNASRNLVSYQKINRSIYG